MSQLGRGTGGLLESGNFLFLDLGGRYPVVCFIMVYEPDIEVFSTCVVLNNKNVWKAKSGNR